MAFWTKTGLSYVASAVGRPLHTDKLTAIKKRISYARVCVEVEASEELVKDFYLQCENGEWVTVYADYEWKPAICTSCRVFGHSTVSCGKKTASQEGTKQVVAAKQPVSSGEWVPVGKKGKAKAGSSNETVNVIGDKHDKAESSTVNDETEAGQGGNDTDPGEFGVANSGMKPVNDVQQTIGSEVGHSDVLVENRVNTDTGSVSVVTEGDIQQVPAAKDERVSVGSENQFKGEGQQASLGVAEDEGVCEKIDANTAGTGSVEAREEVAAAGTSLSVNTPVRTSVPACISEGDTPSSASPETNPLGEKAKDSMENKRAGQKKKNSKGKSNKKSPPKGGRRR